MASAKRPIRLIEKCFEEKWLQRRGHVQRVLHQHGGLCPFIQGGAELLEVARFDHEIPQLSTATELADKDNHPPQDLNLMKIIQDLSY